MAERIAAAMEPKQSKIDKQAKAAFERTMETLRLMYRSCGQTKADGSFVGNADKHKEAEDIAERGLSASKYVATSYRSRGTYA